jgi:hypothetical protein
VKHDLIAACCENREFVAVAVLRVCVCVHDVRGEFVRWVKRGMSGDNDVLRSRLCLRKKKIFFFCPFRVSVSEANERASEIYGGEQLIKKKQEPCEVKVRKKSKVFPL